MATHYVTRQQPKRKQQRPVSRSRVNFLHHVAWGIVCIILLVMLATLWSQAGSLESQNAVLRSQLATAKTAPTTCKATDAWAAGTTKQLSAATTQGQRSLLVHLPKNFVDNQYFPLVMFYPGKGAQAPAAEAAYGLDNLPAIVVYPFPTEGTDGKMAWEGAPYSSSADDVSFTAAILDKLQVDMCIDKTRIYATGFSNGGGFASLLSCKLPGRFAAYAIESGALYYPDGDCSPPQPSPIISIHGDNDPIIPYDGVEWRHLPPVYDWSAMRASIEKCGQPVSIYPDTTTDITTWDHCRGGGMVQNVRIVGGDHAWGEVSNDTLWKFLSKFSL